MKKSKTPKITTIAVNPQNIDGHVDLCKSNRARTRKHVNTWKRAVRKKYFRNGGIIFADEEGFYDDAQHRLKALQELYEAGETTEEFIFHVVSGMDRPTLNMMVDAGKKRTNTDRLKAMQVKYAPLINSAIEEIIDFMEKWRKSAAMLLPDETLAFYRANADELDYLAKAYFKSEDIQDDVLVALAYLFKRINQKKCQEFFADLAHRTLLKAGQPLKAFFDMLGRQDFIMTVKPSLKNRYIKNALIVAWNAHLKGESLQEIGLIDEYLTIEGTASIVRPTEEEEQEAEPVAGDTNGEGETETETEDETESESETVS
jgi:hypothetical protein